MNRMLQDLFGNSDQGRIRRIKKKCARIILWTDFFVKGT